MRIFYLIFAFHLGVWRVAVQLKDSQKYCAVQCRTVKGLGGATLSIHLPKEVAIVDA